MRASELSEKIDAKLMFIVSSKRYEIRETRAEPTKQRYKNRQLNRRRLSLICVSFHARKLAKFRHTFVPAGLCIDERIMMMK